LILVDGDLWRLMVVDRGGGWLIVVDGSGWLLMVVDGGCGG